MRCCRAAYCGKLCDECKKRRVIAGRHSEVPLKNSNALYHPVGICFAWPDQLHVEYVVRIGTCGRPRLTLAPPPRLLVVPRLEMARDQALALLLGGGALDVPALVPQDVERRPTGVV